MFVIGFISKEERAELEARGWEVEDASSYDRVVGDGEGTLMLPPPEDLEAVAIWVDSSVMDVMNGPDWEGGKT